MLFVFCTLGDPFLDESDLLRFDGLMLRRWRHDVVVGRGDAPHQLGSLRMPFDDDWFAIIARLEGKLLLVQPHWMFFGFSARRVRPVAMVAILGEKRLDLVIERNLFPALRRVQTMGNTECSDKKGDQASRALVREDTQRHNPDKFGPK